MAVVERAEREVVPELGVPLMMLGYIVGYVGRWEWTYGPMSDGVTGSEGGGRLARVGVVMAIGCRLYFVGVVE